MTAAQAEYAAYRQRWRWRLLRWLRRRIDGGQCTYPGCPERTWLECHHKHYNHRGKNFFAELMDCRMLCRKHHQAAHYT